MKLVVVRFQHHHVLSGASCVMRTSSSTITYWQRRNINGPCGPVVVGWRPCEPHYPTLLSLGGGSHLKGESHPSPYGLVFWGDWAFPWRVRRRTVLSLYRNSGAEAKLCNRCIGLITNPIPPVLDSSLCLHSSILRRLFLSLASEFHHVGVVKPLPHLLFIDTMSISPSSSPCCCVFFMELPLHPEQNI
jgi:hypothetical protein